MHLRNKNITLGQIIIDNHLIFRDLYFELAIVFCFIESRLNWKTIENLDKHMKCMFQMSLFLQEYNYLI